MNKIKRKVRLVTQKNAARLHAFWIDRRGQGTTEYAILVGVLAVIAIVAITAFKGSLSNLWDAIKLGIKGLGG